MRIPARLQRPRRRWLAVFWSSNSRHRNAQFTRWTENRQLVVAFLSIEGTYSRYVVVHASFPPNADPCVITLYLPDRRTTSTAGITCPPMNPFNRLQISQLDNWR